MTYTFENHNTKEKVVTDLPYFTVSDEDNGENDIFIGSTNVSAMSMTGKVDKELLNELLEQSDWEVTVNEDDLVKCISCGAVSHLAKGDAIECQSCDSSDLHSTLVGQTVGISVLTDDTDLSEWCQDHKWDGFKVTSYDGEGLLVWVEDCPYAIQVQDLD